MGYYATMLNEEEELFSFVVIRNEMNLFFKKGMKPGHQPLC